ncbi:uncharacterized protein DS421_18g605450 [Arachis hypogaea]|nr:uncharacterized protein DS421_18g605450 [Arachis hypogaea]
MNKLSHFLDYATSKHFQAELHVLHYLNVLGVLFSTSVEFTYYFFLTYTRVLAMILAILYLYSYSFLGDH